MKVVVMANQNTFQILDAKDCPPEFTASNGWKIYNCGKKVDYMVMNGQTLNVDITGSFFSFSPQYASAVIPALTALHEMVYQHKPVFEDDGQTVTMEHGKFWIVERPGGQVCFQVLEMDETFRRVEKIESHNLVVSSCNPDLYPKIWLRGYDKDGDFMIAHSDEFTRTQIIEALRDWSDNWPGWTSHKPTLEQCCERGTVAGGGVFVFESEVK